MLDSMYMYIYVLCKYIYWTHLLQDLNASLESYNLDPKELAKAIEGQVS